jgi:hypothetical protein
LEKITRRPGDHLLVVELAEFERIVCIHKMVNLLTKHNFHFIINRDVHGRTTRRNSHIHIFNQHSSFSSANVVLSTALSEYNSIDSATRKLTNLRTFKAKVKFKIMNNSDKFRAISPYYFINWPSYNCDFIFIFIYVFFLISL